MPNCPDSPAKRHDIKIAPCVLWMAQCLFSDVSGCKYVCSPCLSVIHYSRENVVCVIIYSNCNLKCLYLFKLSDTYIFILSDTFSSVCGRNALIKFKLHSFFDVRMALKEHVLNMKTNI